MSDSPSASARMVKPRAETDFSDAVDILGKTRLPARQPVSPADPDARPSLNKLQKRHFVPMSYGPQFDRVELYVTPNHVHLFGSRAVEGEVRHIRLDRNWDVRNPRQLRDILDEDEGTQTELEKSRLLEMIKRQNKGDMQKFEAVGVLGFTRFLLGYSIVLITARQLVCSIDGHAIYAVKGTEVVRISNDDLQKKKSSWFRSLMNVGTPHYTPVEERYHAMFDHALDELSKDFFFSYTYDATKHLQTNCVSAAAAATTARATAAAAASGLNATGVGAEVLNFEDRFCWNQFLLTEFIQLASAGWILPVSLGCAVQKSCNVFSNFVTVTVIGRRSRHYAGTRYLKRGASDAGDVANDVEVEQIVEDGNGHFSSFVQMRGSIPLFWAQEPSATVVRPDIQMKSRSPEFVRARLHFEDMFQRYGAPCQVMNLVKKKEKKDREKLIGSRFKECVDFFHARGLPADALTYEAIDVTNLLKRQGDQIALDKLFSSADLALRRTGFFCSAPRKLHRSYAPVAAAEEASTSGQALDPSFLGQTHAARAAAAALETKQRVVRARERSNGQRSRAPSSTHAEEQAGEVAYYTYAPHAVYEGVSTEASIESTSHPSVCSNVPTTRDRLARVLEQDGREMPGYLLQQGCWRVNCVDCLDRTNLAQKVAGIHALEVQLYTMGVLPDAAVDTYFAKTGQVPVAVGEMLPLMSHIMGEAPGRGYRGTGRGYRSYHSDRPCVQILHELYNAVGNRIAIQYGGSAAHEKLTGRVTETVDEAMSENSMAARMEDSPDVRRADRSRSYAEHERNAIPTIGSRQKPGEKGRSAKQKLKKIKVGGKSGIAGKADKLKESIRRHYHNAFTDVNKQDAINIFLGMYRPYSGPDAAVWDKRRAATQSRLRNYEATLPWEYQPHLWELQAMKGSLHTDYYLHNTAPMRRRRKEDMLSYMPGQWWVSPIARFRGAFVNAGGTVGPALAIEDKSASENAAIEDASNGKPAQSSDPSKTLLTIVPAGSPMGASLADPSVAYDRLSPSAAVAAGIRTLSHRVAPGMPSQLASLECKQTPGPPMPHTRLMRAARVASGNKRGRLIRFNRVWRPRHGGSFATASPTPRSAPAGGSAVANVNNTSDIVAEGNADCKRTFEVCDLPVLTEFDELLHQQHLKGFFPFDPTLKPQRSDVPSGSDDGGLRRLKTGSLTSAREAYSQVGGDLHRSASSRSIQGPAPVATAGDEGFRPKSPGASSLGQVDARFSNPNRRRFRERSADSFFLLASERLYHRPNANNGLASQLDDALAGSNEDLEDETRLKALAKERERKNMERLVAATTAPVSVSDRNIYKASLNVEQDTLDRVDEFYQRKLVTRIKKAYSAARRVFKGLANGNAPIATVPATKPRGNSSLVVSKTSGGVSIVGREQHARAARRRRRNGRRSSSDRQRRREGSMLLVGASYLNSAFSAPPPEQYETLALERFEQDQPDLVRLAAPRIVAANDVPYFRMFDRLDVDLTTSGKGHDNHRLHRQQQQQQQNLQRFQRQKSQTRRQPNLSPNSGTADSHHDAAINAPTQGHTQAQHKSNASLQLGSGPPDSLRNSGFPGPRTPGAGQPQLREQTPVQQLQQKQQQHHQQKQQAQLETASTATGGNGSRSQNLSTPSEGSTTSTQQAKHQQMRTPQSTMATRNQSTTKMGGVVSQPPPAPKLPTASDLLHGPARRPTGLAGQKGSKSSLKARLLMLSGSTAAALKAARAEQSKILSSLQTHSRFQYRHYYHIQHFFVAYYSLLHRMAEESNQKQDSTMLNATLAFMYAYLKEFMLSVEDANQAGDFCAEQMQLSGITCSKIFTRGAHIGRAKDTPVVQAMMESWFSRCDVAKQFYSWSQQAAPLVVGQHADDTLNFESIRGHTPLSHHNVSPIETVGSVDSGLGGGPAGPNALNSSNNSPAGASTPARSFSRYNASTPQRT